MVTGGLWRLSSAAPQSGRSANSLITFDEAEAPYSRGSSARYSSGQSSSGRRRGRRRRLSRVGRIVVFSVSLVLFFWILILWRWFKPLFVAEVKEGPTSGEPLQSGNVASLVQQQPYKRRPVSSPPDLSDESSNVESETPQPKETDKGAIHDTRKVTVVVNMASEAHQSDSPKSLSDAEQPQSDSMSDQATLGAETESLAPSQSAEDQVSSLISHSSSTVPPPFSSETQPRAVVVESRGTRSAGLDSLAEEPIFAGLGLQQSATGGTASSSSKPHATKDSLRGSAAKYQQNERPGVTADSARIAKVHGVAPEELRQEQPEDTLQTLAAVRSAQEAVVHTEEKEGT